MRRKKDSEIEKDDAEIRPSKFTQDEAKRKIRQILREGDTILSDHLLKDIAAARHGVS